MHCCACDALLSDFESTRKSETTGDYLDLCNRCYETIADVIDVDERMDLLDYEDEREYTERDFED